MKDAKEGAPEEAPEDRGNPQEGLVPAEKGIVGNRGSKGDKALSGGSTVADFEKYLFGMFPEEHCEPWDRSGLLVGDSSTEVKGVAIALDPQVETIDKAAARGCNVLLTHHPAYLDAPDRIVDFEHGGSDAALRVAHAIRNDVALIAMHTNLDRSPLAMAMLLSRMGLSYVEGLVDDGSGKPPFGCIGVPSSGEDLTLSTLAYRCEAAFGIYPRVWGDPGMELHSVGVANGSSSSFASDIVDLDIDCLVTGEMSYHHASEVAASGMAVIELGHDVSEFPLLDVLGRVVESSDTFGRNVCMLEPDICWWQPGMVRK